jgi:predicted nuclease of restriction endonuclease-like (RecB) superfamily
MKTAPNSEMAISEEPAFSQIVQLIQSSRQQAFETVNAVLIDLYWRVGEIVSRKLESTEWGMGVVPQLANYISRRHPGVRGFTKSNLFRMRQFYDTYTAEPIVAALLRQLPGKEVPIEGKKAKVAPLPRQSEDPKEPDRAPHLLRQLSWTHHLIILGQSKRAEEREFYVTTAIRERWSSRQLERQFKAALFETVVLNPPKVSVRTRQIYPEALSVFRDTYTLEFLGLPTPHAEGDLHRGLLHKLKDFLLEMGRDFCFVSSEYPVQVGGRDFALDLLFFHRGLNCLVAMELKVGRFEPEYLGKLTFYLEALDRDVRKPHEQPSIGVLLCASKDDEVVEYALSRTLSPALIAEYQTQLPDKKILQAKLHEFYLQNSADSDVPKKG